MLPQIMEAKGTIHQERRSSFLPKPHWSEWETARSCSAPMSCPETFSIWVYKLIKNNLSRYSYFLGGDSDIMVNTEDPKIQSKHL